MSEADFAAAPAGESAPGPALAVDAHAHVFTRALPLAADRRYVPAGDAPLSTYLQTLDAARLTHGVLVQPSFLGTDNSHLLQALASAPQRLRGIAVVDPSIPTEDLERLGRHGVVGIRLNLLDKTTPVFDGPDWARLFDFIGARRWQVEVHAHAHALMHAVTPLLARGVRVVVDHFGRPDSAAGRTDPAFKALLASAGSGRVWVKLSGSYRFDDAAGTHAAACAADLLDAFGPQRLVWGSDWPHTTFEDRASFGASRAALDAWITDPRIRAQILGATAAELFHIDAEIAA